MKRIFGACGVALGLWASVLTADVVRMRNGEVYEGRILEKKASQYVLIQLRDGGAKRLRWGEIQSAQYGALSEMSEKPKADYSSEILAASTVGTGIFNSAGHVLSVSAGYHLWLATPIQIGINMTVSEAGGGSSSSVFNAYATAGPTLNFPFGGEYTSLFFIYAGAGMSFSSQGSNSSSAVLVEAACGKRFRILENVSYRPSVGVQKVMRTNTNTNVIVVPLAFSLVF